VDVQDTKKRIETAYKLLTSDTTSKEKFESIRTLIKGLNPKLDTLLKNTSKILSDIEKLQKADIVILSAEHLPENTEEEKKRKKKLLLLINSWRNLTAEVKRISLELENMKGSDGNNKTTVAKIESIGRITAFAKGPFGLITLGAIIVVGVSLFFAGNNPQIQTKTEVLPAQRTPNTTSKIQVIIFNGKKLPLKDLHTSIGPECISLRIETSHYHALNNGFVKSLDGETVKDPGGCGFGKVNETEIIEVE
jgi:hypothetical protein